MVQYTVCICTQSFTLIASAVNLYRNNKLLTCTYQGRSIIGYNYTKAVMHNALHLLKLTIWQMQKHKRSALYSQHCNTECAYIHI